MKNPSAVKRHKQSEVRRMRNRIAKSTVRTMAKKYTLAVKEGDKDNATSLLRTLVSKLDTIARKGIIKKTNQLKRIRNGKIEFKLTNCAQQNSTRALQPQEHSRAF